MPRKKPRPPALVGGPYSSPLCRVDGDFPCVIHGDRPVRGLTDAPIPWPYAYGHSKRQLLVSGDLERAIRTESVAAVVYYWGMSRAWVESVRRKLGVPRMTPGTTQLWRDLTPARLGDPRKYRGGSASKLGPKQVAAILRRAAKGESRAALAAEFKVSRQYIGQLVAGRRRRPAPEAEGAT